MTRQTKPTALIAAILAILEHTEGLSPDDVSRVLRTVAAWHGITLVERA